nr:alpha/beta hydrolase [Bacteroidota bacterium]
IESILADSSASKEFDQEIRNMMLSNVDIEWSFANGMFTFGVDTPSEFIRMAKPYSMKDHAHKIQCKILVVDSEGDKSLPGQARKLFEALKCEKEFMLFTTEEGAEEHCQMGAVMISGERILNWLEDNLMD